MEKREKLAVIKRSFVTARRAENVAAKTSLTCEVTRKRAITYLLSQDHSKKPAHGHTKRIALEVVLDTTDTRKASPVSQPPYLRLPIHPPKSNVHSLTLSLCDAIEPMSTREHGEQESARLLGTECHGKQDVRTCASQA